MRKIFAIGMLLFAVGLWLISCTSIPGDVGKDEDAYYRNWKAQKFAHIQKIMQSPPSGIFIENASDLIREYTSLFNLRYRSISSITDRLLKKVLSARCEDIKQTWSNLDKDWIYENTQIINEQTYARIAQKSLEFSKKEDLEKRWMDIKSRSEGGLQRKHMPLSFFDLPEKNQQATITALFGDRLIVLKSEWDMKVAQQSVWTGRDIDGWYKDKGNKDKFRLALANLMVQEYLWYLGYQNRFISGIEYQVYNDRLWQQKKGLVIDWELYNE